MAGRRVNVNVGVLGHIDSGKTALARALSTTASTAAFDKQPQSRERGVTLDLGFSCFSVPLPERLRPALRAPEAGSESAEPLLQVTLVDCPGHASLIRTIIGGFEEHRSYLWLPSLGDQRPLKQKLHRASQSLLRHLHSGKQLLPVLAFGAFIPFLPTVASPSKSPALGSEPANKSSTAHILAAPSCQSACEGGGTHHLPESWTCFLGHSSIFGSRGQRELLTSQIPIPARDPSGPFLMAVDHCFSIKGQGTVMTGTILSGSIGLGDSVEIPALKVVKKVKSMQMFHMTVTSAMQGDRLGVCVTQFDPRLLERGLVCTPESLHTIHAALISLEKIPYFRGPLQTKAKFHITVGHETVMGRLMFFSLAPESFDHEPVLDTFDFSCEYLFQEQYLCKDSAPLAGNGASDRAKADPKMSQVPEGHYPRQQWALVEFEKPVTCPHLCLVIGSRLDTDIHTNNCRLAFHGTLLHGLEDKNYTESFLPRLKVYKLKHKHGLVERAMDDYSVIGRSLFKKETNIQLFVGLKVHLSTGELGVIDSAFGQSGKFKVHIPGRTEASSVSAAMDSPQNPPDVDGCPPPTATDGHVAGCIPHSGPPAQVDAGKRSFRRRES
ncbi:selenocysteine-specific elongation factor isoform X2 [Tamandua tetradactyla]|uniref:selenocysteine-specific elongation factor isoform X2 n=1 Tax=Tamandua tetradactyla TaxID=48850 RepID=UPI004054490A